MRPLVVALFGLALPILPAAASQAAQPLARTFGSFSVSCSTLAGFCAASGTDLADQSETQHLVIGRRHAQDAAWWIGFDVGAGRLDTTRPITVAVDDRPATTFAPGSGWAITSHPGFASLMDGPAATELLAAMAAGSKVTLKGTTPDGMDQERAFALDGLGAAKGWIDAQQQRKASPLEAGPSPLEPIDAATEARFAAYRDGPFPPKLLAAHRALSAKAAKDRRLVACELPPPIDGAPSGVAPGVGALRLTAERTLFVVGCAWHVYQGTDAVFLAEDVDLSRLTPLRLPIRARGKTSPGRPYVDAYGVDPLFRDLWNHTRARGADDCGEEQIWRFDGKAMRLVEQHAAACAKTGPGEAVETLDRPAAPFVFPVVWQEPAETR